MSAVPQLYAAAEQVFDRAAARSLAPRKPLTVSQWADAHRVLSPKGSAEPGQWRTDRNPLLREPMDALSARSPVREVVLMWPIQIGKTEVALNFIGYSMDHDPGPMMVALPGDPALPDVWVALTDLLNRPIQHESGALLNVEATAIDAAGHRTDFVYAYVRGRHIRRPMAIFGAVPNNAPVLSKGKMLDVTHRDRSDRWGIRIYHVGTVVIKHRLYSVLSADADKAPEQRMCHFSADLPQEFFPGLVSESYNPSKNRFEKKRGARNEPLDTWGYSYAAAHHPELYAHRKSKADWDALAARVQKGGGVSATPDAPAAPPAVVDMGGGMSLTGWKRGSKRSK